VRMQVHGSRPQESNLQGFTNNVSIRRARQGVTAALGVFGISTL
jgi:hypothetical protein